MLLQLIVFIYKGYCLFFYNVEIKQYVGMSDDHTWATIELYPENAVNFAMEPVNVIEKLYLISKGKDTVLDVSQSRITNRIGYYKRHGKPNQQFQFVDIYTDLPVDIKDLNDNDEYKIMVQGKCLYIAEPKPKKYELFAGGCELHKLRSVFKITTNTLINTIGNNTINISNNYGMNRVSEDFSKNYSTNKFASNPALMSEITNDPFVRDAVLKKMASSANLNSLFPIPDKNIANYQVYLQEMENSNRHLNANLAQSVGARRRANNILATSPNRHYNHRYYESLPIRSNRLGFGRKNDLDRLHSHILTESSINPNQFLVI